MATAKSAGASKTDKSSAAKNSKGPAAKKAADNGGGTAKRSGSATGNGGSKTQCISDDFVSLVRDCQEFDRLSVCVKQTGFGEKQGKFDCIKIRRSQGRHDGQEIYDCCQQNGELKRTWNAGRNTGSQNFANFAHTVSKVGGLEILCESQKE